MALSRKASREIVVDDESYRWTVSMDSGYGVIAVQHGGGSGQRLEAQVPSWDHGDRRSVTPIGIERLIRFALSQGWHPQTSGPPLRLSDIGESIDLFPER